MRQASRLKLHAAMAVVGRRTVPESQKSWPQVSYSGTLVLVARSSEHSLADQAENLGLVTSHGYSSEPGAPFETDLKTWQTE